jgi:hypothetical protein
MHKNHGMSIDKICKLLKTREPASTAILPCQKPINVTPHVHLLAKQKLFSGIDVCGYRSDVLTGD